MKSNDLFLKLAIAKGDNYKFHFPQSIFGTDIKRWKTTILLNNMHYFCDLSSLSHLDLDLDGLR